MKKQILSAIIAGAVALSSSALTVLADENTDIAAETELASSETVTDASDSADAEEPEVSEEGAEAAQATDEAAQTVSGETEVTEVSSVLSSGSFSYRQTGDGAVIVKYNGSASEVEIPGEIDGNEVCGISDNAFSGNKAIKSVTMPDTVTSVGSGAFSDCTALETVNISDNVQIINQGTFENCTSLTSVSLPANLVVIYGSAFSDCTALGNISFPDGLEYFGEGAFYNCTALNNVVVPKAVNDFNGSVFAGCTGLYDISVDSENPYYTSVGNVVYTKDMSKLIAFPSAHTGMYEVTEGTLSIGYAAFYKSGLEQIVLPSTLASIDNAAFVKCEKLLSMVIPSSVTYIGGYAFSGCSSLRTVTIPSSVSEIGDYTFANCPELMKVVIPSSVTAFGRDVFSGCSRDCVVETDSDSSAAAAYAKNLGMNVSYSSNSQVEGEVTEEPVRVTVVFNGEPMELESPATIINDNTVVPMRALFEKMGAEVSWNEEEYVASAWLDDVTVYITIGSNIMLRNGEEIALEAPALIIDDLTFVPLRAVAEAFGAEVFWHGDGMTAYVDFYDYPESEIPYDDGGEDDDDHDDHDHADVENESVEYLLEPPVPEPVEGVDFTVYDISTEDEPAVMPPADDGTSIE